MKLTETERINKLKMWEEILLSPKKGKRFPAMAVKRVPGKLDRRYKLKIGWSKIESLPYGDENFEDTK